MTKILSFPEKKKKISKDKYKKMSKEATRLAEIIEDSDLPTDVRFHYVSELQVLIHMLKNQILRD